MKTLAEIENQSRKRYLRSLIPWFDKYVLLGMLIAGVICGSVAYMFI